MQNSLMFKFRKVNRLLKKLEFKRVLDTGCKVVHPNFVLYGEESQDNTRLGLTVSKKVGGAVVRNKVKRRLRESFRLLLPGLDGESNFDIVVIARYRAKGIQYEEFNSSFINCVNRLQKKLSQRANAK